jgi:DNA-binding transcriptional regulator YiaG
MKPEEVVPVMPVAPMSEADIEAAAASDPDNLPLAPEQESQLRPVPRVRTLRRALGLKRNELAARYHIPLGTLQDWEQGRSQLDPPAHLKRYSRVTWGNLHNPLFLPLVKESLPLKPSSCKGQILKTFPPKGEGLYPTGWK